MSRRFALALVLPCMLVPCLAALGGCELWLSSAKGFTRFGFVAPEVRGTVDASAVAVPDATDVSALTATFTTTG